MFSPWTYLYNFSKWSSYKVLQKTAVKTHLSLQRILETILGVKTTQDFQQYMSRARFEIPIRDTGSIQAWTGMVPFHTGQN